MTGTALSPRDALKQRLAQFLPSYGNLLPKGYEPERLVTGALVSVQRNPDLLKCDPMSVATALASVAQWGLDLGTTAHLVPFGKTCTPMADYKGYIELIVDAGARKVEAKEVRAKDVFEFAYGTDPYLQHRPGPLDAPITHAYAIVTLKGGVTQFEVMTAEEIDDIRRVNSKSWSKGPLTGWYARKTVIRRIAKYVPKTKRLSAVLAGDELEPAPLEVTPEVLAALEPQRVPGERALKQGGYDPETGEVTEPTAPTASTPRPAPSHPRGEPAMPFGKSKGTALSEMDEDDLRGAMEWAASKGKFTEFQAEAMAELTSRAGGVSGSVEESFDDVPAALQVDDRDLPF